MEEKLENTKQLKSSEKNEQIKQKSIWRKWLELLQFIIFCSIIFFWLYLLLKVLRLDRMPWACRKNPNYDPNYDCNQYLGTTHEESFGTTGYEGFSVNNNSYIMCEDKYHIERYCLHKPIIYLYPTTETQINVQLWAPENLLHTYPKYNSEKWWNIIAQPNWDLEDIDTWRKLYALYREWKNDNVTDFDEWFVVAWKDTIPFLEEKLAILWLNEREAEEFIVYWLPQMENNEWNLIRFETIEEQDENMPLNIAPDPDTVIRVMMDWKAIDELINIPEQQLTTPERKWFTVVEWWGSQIL